MDGSGNIVLTGHFWGTVDFGGGPLTALPFFEDIFIAKLDTDGKKYIWSQGFGGDYTDRGLSVAGGGSDSFVATGSFSGTVDFGGVPPPDLLFWSSSSTTNPFPC